MLRHTEYKVEFHFNKIWPKPFPLHLESIQYPIHHIESYSQDQRHTIFEVCVKFVYVSSVSRRLDMKKSSDNVAGAKKDVKKISSTKVCK